MILSQPSSPMRPCQRGKYMGVMGSVFAVSTIGAAAGRMVHRSGDSYIFA